MSNITRMSMEEILAKHERCEVQKPVAPIEPNPDLPDDFWDDAELVLPQVKTAISLRVDPDVLDYFKAQGSGHLTRMHAVLKSYVDAQKHRGQS